MTEQDEKAQFFALYWGQRVAANSARQYSPGWLVETPLLEVSTEPYEWKMKKWYLELTPLYLITDEDAIKVANICFNDPNRMQMIKIGRHAIWYFFEVGLPVLNKIWTNEIDQSFGCNKMIYVADYLRSKGYTLPWKNYSVEDLVNMGWVKLKQD